MTLILTLGNSDYFIQVSDRRLSVNGKLEDDESNKAGVLVTKDARLAYGFTGLARTASGFVTSRWLNSALYECAPPDYSAYGLLQRLAERAAHDFENIPAVSSLRPLDKALAVVFSGYLYTYDPPRAVLATISNLAATIGAAPTGHHFRFEGTIQKSGDSSFSLVRPAGFLVAVKREDLDSLQALPDERRPVEALIGKAIEVMYAIADRPQARGTIGKQLSSIVITRDPQSNVATNYHSGVATHTSYIPDVLHALAHGQRRAYLDVSLRATDPTDTPPLAVPKVGRNEPCPCGSGRKYKRCHGRRRH